MKTCQYCDQPVAAKGLCDGHYRRLKRGLEVDVPLRVVLRNVSIEDRMAAYIDRRGPDQCWPWTRGRDADGYGEVAVGGGKNRRAHVVAWEIANGRKLPPGMCVMHSCDNPPCCNDAHLSAGTNVENVSDRQAKGRSARQKGSDHGMARITDDEVRLIRYMVAQEGRGAQARAARRFGISQASVSLIVNRKTWTHI